MSGREEAAPPPIAAVRELALEGDAAIGSPVAIPPRTFGERARRVVIYVLMVTIALLYLVPFVYTVATSFKTQAEAAAGFDLWPDQASLAAYREIWSREDLSFVTFFRNSLILASSITLITLFLATLGGYAFARLRFPFREPLFLLVLGTLMIPDQLRLVPCTS
jgi:multiple sugar transport system permease protein